MICISILSQINVVIYTCKNDNALIDGEYIRRI